MGPVMFDPLGFGILAAVSIAASLVFTVLLTVLIVLGIRWLLRQDRLARPERRDDEAVAILRERFARGEIDADEYEERRRALGG